MSRDGKRIWWAVAAASGLAVLAASLLAQSSNSVVVAGQSGSARVIQVSGRNYVAVEDLARLVNGSISFNGNQIVLTLPGTASDGSAPAPAPTGFSKDFITAGIEAMAQIREWHAALRNAIQRGVPLADDWLSAYRNQAQQAVRLAGVAASTPTDKNTVPFLNNEFNTMRALTDKYLQMTTSMTYIDPNSLDNDPLDQKLRACGHSLASMATANQFVDDGSCQ
jgi:hypothetical protein